jgi:hypothetical protein
VRAALRVSSVRCEAEVRLQRRQQHTRMHSWLWQSTHRNLRATPRACPSATGAAQQCQRLARLRQLRLRLRLRLAAAAPTRAACFTQPDRRRQRGFRCIQGDHVVLGLFAPALQDYIVKYVVRELPRAARSKPTATQGLGPSTLGTVKPCSHSGYRSFRAAKKLRAQRPRFDPLSVHHLASAAFALVGPHATAVRA